MISNPYTLESILDVHVLTNETTLALPPTASDGAKIGIRVWAAEELGLTVLLPDNLLSSEGSLKSFPATGLDYLEVLYNAQVQSWVVIAFAPLLLPVPVKVQDAKPETRKAPPKAEVPQPEAPAPQAEASA